jgi:adenosine deaminase
VWSWQNKFLREYEDFVYISEAVAEDLQRQNHRYVEMMFSPSLFKRYGLATQDLTASVRKGLAKVDDIEVSLIADLVRDFGPESEARSLAELAEVMEMGLIGIGIGGSEHDYPPEPFAPLYEQAREFGFHTMAHAGEAAGSESVWGAIHSLEVERIGHGTRAGEDEALLEYLVEKEIPLDMCPLSNVKTGVVSELELHPIKRYCERGVLVTVNTDDPKMFGNSLAEEFSLLEEKLHFSREAIWQLTSNAIRASWLPEERKSRLKALILEDPAWQRQSTTTESELETENWKL